MENSSRGHRHPSHSSDLKSPKTSTKTKETALDWERSKRDEKDGMLHTALVGALRGVGET